MCDTLKVTHQILCRSELEPRSEDAKVGFFFHSTTTMSLPSDFPIDLLQQSACCFTTLSKISRALAIAKLLSAISITWCQSIPGILYSFPLLRTFSPEKLVYKSPHWTVHIFYHFCIIVLIISP